jgi:hypothetical protein
MDREALEAELTDLKRKAKKMTDAPGYAQTLAAVKARIAEIEAELAVPVEP